MRTPFLKVVLLVLSIAAPAWGEKIITADPNRFFNVGFLLIPKNEEVEGTSLPNNIVGTIQTQVSF